MSVQKSLLAALVVATTLSVPNASAEPTQTFNKIVQDIKFGGDLRIRQEYFDKDTQGQQDRSRQRLRLRFGWEFTLPYKFKVHAKFASGTGEQVSTNQSFDNLSSQKSIWIDQAYAQWTPGIFDLRAGRMANPIWRPYSDDVVWDSDYNPEGFSQSLKTLVGPIEVSATSLQMVVDEDSSYNVGSSTQNSGGEQADQWMFANQLTVETKLPLQTRLKVGYANYYWKNENQGTLSQAATNEGNRRSSGGVLLNNFNVDAFTGELRGWAFNKPVSLQGTYVKNRAAKDSFSPKEDTGYQWGVIYGKASDKNTWEVAYFNKHVRTDATVADISDSDFGDGGTNRKGDIVWVAYAPVDFMLISAKYFDTEVINNNLEPSYAPVGGRRLGDDINRFQLDWSLKF